MLLKTNQRVFSIFQTLRSSKDVNVYLATDAQVAEKKFLINEIHNPDIIRACIEDMLALQKENNFSAFVDVFTSDSKLYVVFTYSKPYLLKDYRERHHLTYANRVQLLEQYLFQLSSFVRYPSAILASLTDGDNINVYADETIFFNFSLHPQYLLHQTNKTTVYRNVARLIKNLFPDEVYVKKGRQLAVIIEKCEKSIYKSIPELIKDVQHVDTSSLGEKWKQFLELRKSQFQAFKSIAIGILIVFLLIIVYTRFISPSAVETFQPAVPVNQIGEVFLHEDSSESIEGSESLDEDFEDTREHTADTPPVIQVQTD